MNFDFDEELKEVVKSVPGSTYSSTHKCFYVDYSEENLKNILKALDGVAYVDISKISTREKVTDPVIIKTGNERSSAATRLSIGTSGNEPENFQQQRTKIEIIKEEDQSDTVQNNFSLPRNSGNVEFRIDEKKGLLVIKFKGRYDQEWISEMKTYGKCYYDKQRREWMLRWSKLTCDSLADYFTGRGVEVNVKKKVADKTLLDERKVTGEKVRGKPLGRKALDGLDSLAMFLDENRYSIRTRMSYLSMLEFFFRYFSEKEPHEITEDEISRFIYDFIIRLGYSPAYQNQMISAIKIYYKISGRGKVRAEFFERPRRSRALPKVFSKEEVSRILNSSRNIKHKLLLWMIYSCGLRRSEVTNIKLSDLDRDRNILHIREGKGNIDRITPVSAMVWEKIDEYNHSYHPRVYLFEGQKGGKYSSESVYRVFKEALNNAGIKKEVGVHSLRHSYATHLHESGLDIKYIQELLGHKSTRTTEIYTHISRRNLVAVRSPIEDLDVK